MLGPREEMKIIGGKGIDLKEMEKAFGNKNNVMKKAR
jgi:hypothetical protein